MAKSPEAKLQSKIVKAIEGLRRDGLPVECLKLHVSFFMRTGEPDLLVVADGRALFLEVKTDSGSLRPLQEVRLAAWRKAGAVCAVVRSVDEALSVIHETLGDTP